MRTLFITGLLLALAFTHADAQHPGSQYYHAEYNYQLLGTTAGPGETSFLKNFLSEQLFDSLTYQSYSCSHWNYVVAKTKDLNGERGITNGRGQVKGRFTLSGPDALLINYDDGTCAELSDSSGRQICHKYTDVAFYRTANKKTINGYACTEWRPKERKYAAIHVWATKQLPACINPAFYSKGIEGAVVLLEVEARERYALTKLEKVQLDIRDLPCKGATSDYNMAEKLIDR